MDILGLIAQGEGESLEFKSSFRWDFELNRVNKDLTKVAAKTMAGFLNVQGGTLIIGVEDDHTVVGLTNDLGTLSRKDADGFEQTLRAGLAKYLGPDVTPFVRVEFHTAGDEQVALAIASAHEDPVFFHDGDRQDFYVRDGNATKPLDVKATHDYIRRHWRLEKQEVGGLEALKQELLAAFPSMEDLRQLLGEVMARNAIFGKAMPETSQELPTWLEVRTIRVLDLFLAALSRAQKWRQVYVISPWISSIDSAALPTGTLLKKLVDDQATAYVVTRPPVEEWHKQAIQMFGDSRRSNVALLPELHMKLFVAITTEATFAMIGSANFTAQSFANREIGVLVSATGEGTAVVRQLRYEAAQLYRSSTRSLIHKADFSAR